MSGFWHDFEHRDTWEKTHGVRVIRERQGVLAQDTEPLPQSHAMGSLVHPASGTQHPGEEPRWTQKREPRRGLGLHQSLNPASKKEVPSFVTTWTNLEDFVLRATSHLWKLKVEIWIQEQNCGDWGLEGVGGDAFSLDRRSKLEMCVPPSVSTAWYRPACQWLRVEFGSRLKERVSRCSNSLN